MPTKLPQATAEELGRLNRTLLALSRSNQAMMRAQDETQFLNEVCQIIVRDCGHAMVWIGYAEQDAAKTVRPVAHAGFETGYLDTLQITWADTERGQGPTGTAIRTGQLCHCRNMLTDPRFEPWREQAIRRGYASSLVVPLLAEGLAFGAITIYSTQPDPFSQDEFKLIQRLADDLAYGIGAIRQRKAREHSERRADLLAETSAQLLTTAAPQTVVDSVCRKVIEFLDCQFFFNFLVDEPAGGLRLNACAGIPQIEARKIEHLDYGGSACGCAARDASRIVLEDIQNQADQRAVLVRAYGVQAYACHPLLVQGRLLGTLSFGTSQRPRFSESELSLMEAVAGLVAIAIDRQRVHDLLQRANEGLEKRVAERTAAVLESEARYRSLVSASAQIVWIADAHGQIAAELPAWQAFTGQTFDQYRGAGWLAAVHPEDRERIAAHWSSAVSSHSAGETEHRLRRHDGQYREMLRRAVPVLEADGAVREWVGTCMDITEHKEAQRRREFTGALLALFAQKSTVADYLRSVLEVLRQWSGCQALGIRVIDHRSEIPYESSSGFDPAFLKLEGRLCLGRDNCLCTRAIRGEVLESDRPLLTPGGSFRADDALAFSSHLPHERQNAYRGICAKFGFASLAVIPIRYRDEALGAIHLADRRPNRLSAASVEFLESMTPLIGEAMHRFQTEAELAEHRNHLESLVQQRTGELEQANAQLRSEITQRKEAEAALRNTARDLQRSNLDLEQFAYVASHDLQEPLRAVGGYIRLLQHRFPENLDPKAIGYINGAVEGATRMERLITDLLAFSRVGTRGGALAPISLNSPLDEALANLQASIKTAQAAVAFDPLPTLAADAGQMAQLFQNLIGNAIKFRGEQPPQIHVGARQEPGRWVLWVRDNGIGIEPQYYQRIFQIFQRLHTRKHYPGTGIGLAICKKIVERHGGAIWVESQPGQGSTFFFALPEPAAGAAASQ